MPDVFVSQKEEKIIKEKHPAKVNQLNKTEFEEIRKTSYQGELPMYEKKPLSSFLFHPDGIDFETRESQEKVILFLRKHPITTIPWIFMTLVMAMVPTFVNFFGLLSEIPSNFLFVFSLIWYLLTTAYFLESFLTWFFNVYIVTDERIVDIDFYNLIYKEVSDANIDRIQDVTYKMGGAIRTLFNYGDVMIQTASEVPNFEFLAVPKPDQVARVLQDLRIEEQQEAIEGRVR